MQSLHVLQGRRRVQSAEGCFPSSVSVVAHLADALRTYSTAPRTRVAACMHVCVVAVRFHFCVSRYATLYLVVMLVVCVRVVRSVYLQSS